MHFEELPDEVLLFYLFPLFSWEELYQTFFDLNQRLNNTLRSLKHLNLTVNSTSQYHPVLDSLTPSIACLTVCLGQFDIAPFSGLRSLYLHYPSLQQRNAIRPDNFPLLEGLKLSYPLHDAMLLNLIFSNAFQHLKHCEFDRTDTVHSWTGSPSLSSLSISVDGSYGTFCVLRACPNIVRLRIIIYHSLQNNVSLPRYSIPCVNRSLQRLFIRAEFEILAPILTCTPNLRWLTFEDMGYYDNHQNLNSQFQHAASILHSLRQLFYLNLTVGTRGWHEQATLHSLHPLFNRVTSNAKSTFISSD